VAIANALQPKATRATPVLSRVNYDVVRSLNFEVGEPSYQLPYYNVLLLIHTLPVYRLWRDETLNKFELNY